MGGLPAPAGEYFVCMVVMLPMPMVVPLAAAGAAFPMGMAVAFLPISMMAAAAFLPMVVVMPFFPIHMRMAAPLLTMMMADAFLFMMVVVMMQMLFHQFFFQGFLLLYHFINLLPISLIPGERD